jgi:hypothetical protein
MFETKLSANWRHAKSELTDERREYNLMVSCSQGSSLPEIGVASPVEVILQNCHQLRHLWEKEKVRVERKLLDTETQKLAYLLNMGKILNLTNYFYT